MTLAPFKVLVLGAAVDPALAASPLGPFEFELGGGVADAHRHDAVLIACATEGDASAWARREDLPQAALDAAVVVLVPDAGSEATLALLRRGVEEGAPPSPPEALARALRHAIERKRLERAARTAYATDMATGLPHQTQLIEHMSHLLALRVREPQPMALLVLRVQGFAMAAARLGSEAGNVLRRKVAVRLRGGLRASDVVASVGADSFGILLGRIESPSDAERVAGKLVKALQQPFMVAGQGQTVAVSVGMALVPEHGNDAQGLLRRAMAQASSLASDGVSPLAQAIERSLGSAANDEG